MNLVQVQEHLKDIPVPLLQQYANGQNPMVPAYMAVGEMKRREVMGQRQQMAQQAAQGPMPTVKEQVEQKAGLMALQAQQQKQAQQQMMQQAQAQPQPIPQGVPSPQQQPQEQPEFAYGGIARLPVRNDMYDFASGGIIAFDGENGSYVPETDEDKLRRAQMLLTQGVPSTQNTAPPKNEDLPSLQAVQPAKDTRPGADVAGLYDPRAQEAAMEALKVQTPEQIAETRKKQRELAGITGEYGTGAESRAREQDAEYKKMLEDRSFNRLLSVLSGIGRGGLGGAAPAYLQATAAEQQADMSHRAKQNELLNSIEDKRRLEKMKDYEGSAAELARQQQLRGDIGGKLSATQMEGQTRFAVEALSNKNSLDRLQVEYQNRLKEAEGRYANEQEMAKIRRDFEVSLEKLRSKNNQALESFRQNAPTEEKKNFDAYLKLWKKAPGNDKKPESDAYTQFWGDRTGGQYKSEKADITGLNQLLISYQKQLEDITLPEAEKTRIRAAVIKTQKDLETAIGRGAQSGSAGGSQLPPGFVPDQPGR